MKNLCLVFVLILMQPSLFASVTKLNKTFEISNTQIYTLKSDVLGRKYDIYIKVPYDYDKAENKNKKYPVLYMNDGPHTFKVASGITHFKSMDKAVLVGIAFAHGENGQHSRVRDLTHVHDKTWTTYKTGGGEKYLEFIEKEVMAFVEGQYRIDANKRILSGHSLGGSFGTWVMLTRTELFSNYILTSPSLWFKERSIFEDEKQFAKNNKQLKANVYYATGSLETSEYGRKEMVRDHREFVAKLRSRNYKGFKVKDEIVEDTDHYSTFPVGLNKGLLWIYKEWGI